MRRENDTFLHPVPLLTVMFKNVLRSLEAEMLMQNLAQI